MNETAAINVQMLTGTLRELLERRDLLTKQREEAEAAGSPNAALLSARIVEINTVRLPDLKKQVKDMCNSAKGAQKHQVAQFIGEIETALNGIGTFVDVNVSEARLRSLQQEQQNCKTARQAKEIERQIRQIHWALKQLREQQREIDNAEETKRRNEEKIRRIDSILYGHLGDSGAEPRQNA